MPCADPGGPEAPITAPFDDSEFYDYYEVQDDGRFEHIAQARHCLGGCTDPVEAVIGRGTGAVIVIGIRPTSLLRLLASGVRVCLTRNPSVRSSIDSFVAGELQELSDASSPVVQEAEDEGV